MTSKKVDEAGLEKRVGKQSLAELEARMSSLLASTGSQAVGRPNPTLGVRSGGAVILVIDVSKSMDKWKLSQARSGAYVFAEEAWQKRYKVGIVTFGSEARLVMEPEHRTEALTNHLERLVATGTTNMSAGISLATRMLTNFGGERVICLCTDGQPDNPAATEVEAAAARGKGIGIITIGIEPSDREFLAKLCVLPERRVMVQPHMIEEGLRQAAKLLPG